MLQIVRLTLDDNGDIIARRPLQPLFEFRDHAMTIARNEASGLWGDYGFDEERQCWWASDDRGRQYRFVVEEIAAADIAA
jgi:hypothetical protein